jgi:carbon monoxide dehydrogenase subunit G
MREFSTTVDIPAAPPTVWSVLADIERWHEWTPSVTRIERLDPGPLAVGARARVRQPRLPQAVWQVTELIEGSGFTWVTSSPGVRVVARHGLEPIADGTRARLSVAFSGLLGPPVAWLTRGLNERYLGLEARGLRERSIRGRAELGSRP